MHLPVELIQNSIVQMRSIRTGVFAAPEFITTTSVSSSVSEMVKAASISWPCIYSLSAVLVAPPLVMKWIEVIFLSEEESFKNILQQKTAQS